MSKTNEEKKLEHEKFYVSIGAAIYDSSAKKFLVVKDSEEEGEYARKFGPWELPGGRIHKDEKAVDALLREIEEETGLTDCEMVGVIDASLSPQPYKETQGFLVTYLLLYKGGEVRVSEEHSEYCWMSLDEMEKDNDFKEWFIERIRKATTRIEREEYLNDLKRLQADFENYKKRVKNDEKELYGHLSGQIVTDLIPVLDNFHAATEHVPVEAVGSPWVTGITYIEKQFEDVLANYGVTPLDAKPGDTFDPSQHEAVDHLQPTIHDQQHTTNDEKADSEQEKKSSVVGRQLIVKVVQKGYQIKGKLVRPAKVIVTEA